MPVFLSLEISGLEANLNITKLLELIILVCVALSLLLYKLTDVPGAPEQ